MRNGRLILYLLRISLPFPRAVFLDMRDQHYIVRYFTYSRGEYTIYETAQRYALWKLQKSHWSLYIAHVSYVCLIRLSHNILGYTVQRKGPPKAKRSLKRY